MLQFLAGFTLGNVVGMYLAQNYDVPNIAKKIDAFKKDVEAKKKPPEWKKQIHVAGGEEMDWRETIYFKGLRYNRHTFDKRVDTVKHKWEY